MLTDQSVNLRIKLDELCSQSSLLRRGVKELRATLEDRDSRFEDMRVMLENRNDLVDALKECVSITREERDRLQLRWLRPSRRQRRSKRDK